MGESKLLTPNKIGAVIAFIVMALGVPDEVVAQTERSRPLLSPAEAPLSSIGGAAVAEPWLYAIDRGESDGSGTLFRLSSTASGGFVTAHFVGETGVEDVFDIAFMVLASSGSDRAVPLLGLSTTF